MNKINFFKIVTKNIEHELEIINKKPFEMDLAYLFICKLEEKDINVNVLPLENEYFVLQSKKDILKFNNKEIGNMNYKAKIEIKKEKDIFKFKFSNIERK